jgi:hypothetical protein
MSRVPALSWLRTGLRRKGIRLGSMTFWSPYVCRLRAGSIGSPNARGIDSVHLAIRASEMDWNNDISDVEVSREVPFGNA